MLSRYRDCDMLWQHERAPQNLAFEEEEPLPFEPEDYGLLSREDYFRVYAKKYRACDPCDGRGCCAMGDPLPFEPDPCTCDQCGDYEDCTCSYCIDEGGDNRMELSTLANIRRQVWSEQHGADIWDQKDLIQEARQELADALNYVTAFPMATGSSDAESLGRVADFGSLLETAWEVLGLLEDGRG